jgi:hypothetical protein
LIYQRQAETGIRRILGVLSLIKKYGAAAVEDACATALDVGVAEHLSLKRRSAVLRFVHSSITSARSNN